MAKQYRMKINVGAEESLLESVLQGEVQLHSYYEPSSDDDCDCVTIKKFAVNRCKPILLGVLSEIGGNIWLINFYLQNSGQIVFEEFSLAFVPLTLMRWFIFS
jgi:uncharacterized protein YxjI